MRRVIWIVSTSLSCLTVAFGLDIPPSNTYEEKNDWIYFCREWVECERISTNTDFEELVYWKYWRILKCFRLVKFRTMKIGTLSSSTHLVDRSNITRFGTFLRKFKLDEFFVIFTFTPALKPKDDSSWLIFTFSDDVVD